MLMNFINAKRQRDWLLIFTLVWTPQLFAVEVPNLFEIELVARSESGSDREIALRQALFAVLDRILIADDIAKLPVIQQLLKNAEHYVKQSQYSALPADEYADTGARQFRVQFDEDQLLDLLSKSQVGVWSEIRPETLVWLVVDTGDGSGRQFYNADTLPDFDNTLTQVAKLKGIPIIYPLLDIEEQQKIAVDDVVSIDSKKIMAASARYDVTSVLAGRVIKKDGCWLSDWQVYFDGKVKSLSGPCLPLKATISTGIKGAYDVLSAYYGVKPEAAGH